MSFEPLAVSQLRIVYVGARIVGHRTLEALLEAGANVVGVLTLDESKADITTAFVSFDDLVERYGLEVRKFTSLNTPALTEWVVALRPHLGIVIGVSQLIGKDLLQVPPRGFIGMHPTLLPQGRGRAPIPWALIKGLERTGASLFYCDPGADTGDLLAQQEVPVYYEDVSATLGERTDDTVIRLLLDCLPGLAEDTAPRIPQDESRASVWPRRRPEDGEMDWRHGHRQLYDWVRALTHPYPGAFTWFNNRRLWVWGARESFDQRRGDPGEVLAVLPQGVVVAAGEGCVLLTRVQWDGEEEIEACHAGLKEGDRFGRSS